MTASENIRRRLGVMFLTSPLIGLMIATPVFLLTQTSIFNLPWIALMISSLSLISWLLNIFLLNFNPIKLNSVFFKWFLSTIFMVLLVSTLHTLTFDLVAFNIKHIWIIRAVNITAVNTIIVIINTLIDTREKKIKLENENNQLKIIQLETQLAHLTNQINPHFLFNSLSSLKSLIRRNPLMAENYLLKLSDFLRISISKSKDLVSLKEELELCSDYIDLQKIRFQEGLIYETDIDSDLLENKIPFFALQTLIENALKHNSLDAENPLKISIQAKNGKITVINNIQTKFQIQTSSQTGLHNLNERLKIYSGQPLNIINNNHFFEVQLKLIET